MLKQFWMARSSQLHKQSNYMWWAIFFLLFYVIVIALAISSTADSRLIISREDIFSFLNTVFPRSVGLAWVGHLSVIILYAFVVTLPLLFFRYRKAVLALIILAFSAYHLYTLRIIPSDLLILFLLTPQFWIGLLAQWATLTAPVLIQWLFPLSGKWGKLFGIVLIIIEGVAALFFSALLVYTSVLASQLPTHPSECGRMEQVTQFVRPWRGYFREHCQLGVGERFLFPIISDDRLKQEALACNVQRVFLSTSGLAGICLHDNSGFITSNEELVTEEFTKAKFDRSCDTRTIDFRYTPSYSEEEVLQDMNTLCISPK